MKIKLWPKKDENKYLYTITDSYNYTPEEMRIICDKIASQYTTGDEEIAKESDQLYNEWVSHNYSYYFFNKTLDGYSLNKASKFLDKDLSESSQHVTFGEEKEKGLRKFALDFIRILGDL